MKLISLLDGTPVGVTDNPNYILLNPKNKCFNLCEEKDATGVAVDSEPYQINGKVLKDGLPYVEITDISEEDAQPIIEQLEAERQAKLEEQMRKAEEERELGEPE